jgi:hypothetical protein
MVADHVGVSTSVIRFWLTPWQRTDEHLFPPRDDATLGLSNAQSRAIRSDTPNAGQTGAVRKAGLADQ